MDINNIFLILCDDKKSSKLVRNVMVNFQEKPEQKDFSVIDVNLVLFPVFLFKYQRSNHS